MNNVVALQPQRPRDYTAEQLSLVKRTVAADCTNDEFSLFVEVCRRVGLDPFRRHIYAVVYSKDKPDKRRMSIITGIDGFRAVAARNRDYRPDEEEAAITYSDSLKDPAVNPLGIEKAVVKAFKLSPDGLWHPVVGVAYWDEFAPIGDEWGKDDTGKWGKTGKQFLGGQWPRMGRVMIAKCAEAQALRRGWPEDLSGVYVQEEMARAEVESTAAEQVEQYQKEQRLKMLNSGDSIMIQWSAGEPLAPVPVGQFMDKSLAFIGGATGPQLNAWAEINRHSLKEFWAQHKGDALELKKAMESRTKQLEAIDVVGK
jgi:phage recombination protein Bet